MSRAPVDPLAASDRRQERHLSAAWELTVSEDDWLSLIVEVATLQGWLVFHALPARTRRGVRTAMMGHQGFVDLVLCKGRWVVFVELKTELGRVALHQRTWLDRLEAAQRVQTYVWRPSQFDQIVEYLKSAV